MDAIIGGTGTEKLLDYFEKEKIFTGFGEVDCWINDKLIFLPRHKVGHKDPPHIINYKALLTALKQKEVERIIGVYAVGSITDEIKPGNWGLVNDFIDLSARNLTFYDNKVIHTDFSQPLDNELTEKIYNEGMKSSTPPQSKSCTYVQTNGPRLETPKEINYFKIIGGDVVGMTAASEIILANELSMKMAAICFSINHASGIKQDADKIYFMNNEKQNELTKKLYKIILQVFAD